MTATMARLQTPSDPRDWVERHGDYLYRFARARHADSDAAEDLVQETLLAAWRGRDAFAGRSTERTWLTGILKRKLVDRLRRRARDRLETAGNLADPATDALFTKKGYWKRVPRDWVADNPDSAPERAEFWLVLHACLGNLPPRLRDVFALKYLDDAPGEDICAELGVTPANFWVTLHRARLRMRHCLALNWYGEPEAGGE